jgi:hypothetical protein
MISNFNELGLIYKDNISSQNKIEYPKKQHGGIMYTCNTHLTQPCGDFLSLVYWILTTN